ncbi:hypothetical protein BKA70DRAFT_1107414 [Coprinopsis sp. MPI-PUGE-AT-0042]|nr:hypothetical protein BKA70DRAFT_1107414 [Coprinopsis sp. MPI-PUGE-AT-0042]
MPKNKSAKRRKTATAPSESLIPDNNIALTAERPTSHPLVIDHAVRRIAASETQSAAALASNSAGPKPGGTKRERAAWVERLKSELSFNPIPYASFIASRTTAADEQLTAAVANFFDTRPDLSPPVPRSNYVSWIIEKISPPNTGFANILVEAVAERQHKRDSDHIRNRRARAEWHGFKSLAAYEQFHSLVFHLWVKRRPAGQERPPRNTWVLEIPETFESDRNYLNTMPLPDRRRHGGQRSTPLAVDTTQLSVTIPEAANVVLHDASNGKIFASVVRNFSGSPAMLGWVKGVVSEAVESRRSVRKEDSGQLVQIGWTGGSRSKPIFGSARNLLRHVADILRVDQRNSVAAAYMWRRVQLMHPPCVGEDIDKWHREHDLPRLDGTWPAADAQTHGPILYPTTCSPITIKEAEFSPGCLVMSENYSRAVHRETPPHEWACFWTTLRTGTNPRGNHFYIADFAVCIRVAEDTSIAWKPTYYHTSSMGSWSLKASFGHRHVEDQVMRQQGICFVTSPRIATIYRQFKECRDLSERDRFERARAALLAERSCDDIYE